MKSRNNSSEGLFSKSAGKTRPFIGARLPNGTCIRWDDLAGFTADMATNKIEHGRIVSEQQFKNEEAASEGKGNSVYDWHDSSPSFGR